MRLLKLLTAFAVILVALFLVVVFILFTSKDRDVLLGKSKAIKVGATIRTYRLAKGSGSAIPRRLVIGIHGYGSSSRQFAYYSALHNAFGPDTIVAYPDAIKSTTATKVGWNASFCCGSGWKRNVDDVEFLRVLIESLRGRFGIEANRVFLVGFSNGGFMTHRFAAEHPELVAAAVVVSGTIGTKATTLKPTKPVPMLLTHGANDTRVMYAGGESPGDSEFDWRSFADTAKVWQQVNGCNDTPTVTKTADRITTEYKGCVAALTTISYLKNAHVWDDGRLWNVWHRKPAASVEAAAFLSKAKHA